MGFDLSTGDDVRSVSLRSGLRGYDKSDVDEFRSTVADLVDDLRRRLDAASGHLSQLGLDDPLDLKEEFASVGKEVTAILEAARSAATDIRRRATEDGEQWRAEAQADAERMRTEAWEEATAHLESAVAEAHQTRSSADEDALFIRAQAEKEAIRLTSEAKRDAEEAVRAARGEADAIRAEARETAEAAQERTRALEVRREELMGELEEARRAIGLVESQIDEQHQRLVAPETTTVRIIDQAVEPAEPEQQRRETWLDEDATVRLVPAEPRTSDVELEPVLDADDIVAEVERLQIEPEVDDPWSPTPAGPGAGVPPDVDPAHEAPVSADTPDDAHVVSTVTTDAFEDEGEHADHAAVAADDAGMTAEPAMEDEPDGVDDEPVAGTDEHVDEGDAPDGLDDLFASLRAPEPIASAASSVTAAFTESTGHAGDVPSGSDETDDTEPMGDDGNEEEPPPAMPSVADTLIPTVVDADDSTFAARESILLPITNRALRAVKKQILEFQNVMLEATKADPDGWRPDVEEYRLALDPHVKALIDEAHRAGGGEAASTVDVAFGEALAVAVTGAAETMSGSGYRETSASLGRIYRSWRSDEAERRLAAVAGDAFDASTASRKPS